MKKKVKSKRFIWREFANRLWYFVAGIITVILLLNVNNNAFNIKDFVHNSLGTSLYNAYVVSNLNDNVTTNIVLFCQGFVRDEQVECVVNQVTSFYNYTPHNQTIRTPTEVQEYGGVCRDATLLYATVFRRLGWRTSFNYPSPNHVNLVAVQGYILNDNNTLYYQCTIDQEWYHCNIY